MKFELSHGADKQLYYTMELGKHKATVSSLMGGGGRASYSASRLLSDNAIPRVKSMGGFTGEWG